MKIYHLIIAYNEEKEEIEYIQEEIEDDGTLETHFEFTAEMDDDYFDDEVLRQLIEEFGLGEA